jgi:D-alanyl-D-alanine carboxypeptidase
MARRMGLARTRFTSPSGLRGNESTPREMAVALIHAMEDPLLADIMRTGQLEIRATDSGQATASGKGKKSSYRVIYNNTNVSLRTSQYTVIGGKTGYTDLARYCLVIGAKIAGKRYAMVFLGAEGELTRFADFQRVANWIAEGKHAGKSVAARGVGGLADAPPGAVTPRLAR